MLLAAETLAVINGHTLNGFYVSSPNTFVAMSGQFSVDPAVALRLGERGTWVLLVGLAGVGRGFARYEVQDREYGYRYFLILPFAFFPHLPLPMRFRFKLLFCGRSLPSGTPFGIPEPLSVWERIQGLGVRVRWEWTELVAWWRHRRRLARLGAEDIAEEIEMQGNPVHS